MTSRGAKNRPPATTADLDRDTLAWCAAFLRALAEETRGFVKDELRVVHRRDYLVRALALESAARRVQACESAATRRRLASASEKTGQCQGSAHASDD